MPRFTIAPAPQAVFIDKDTQAVMSGGEVFFFRDVNRTEHKPVFRQTGTPGNYTYVVLPQPVVLTISGTWGFDQNDIALYYDAVDANGNEELYFMDVFNSQGVPQFTREGWPLQKETGGELPPPLDVAQTNYIYNGQFRANLPVIDPCKPEDAGKITKPVTAVALGNWTFERPLGSAATDLVTFERFGGWSDNPAAHPRFSIRVDNQLPSAGDGFKDVRVKFKDVNFLSDDSTTVTFGFSGRSNAVTSLPMSIVVIKNYGTGGSAEESQTVFTPTLPLVFAPFSVEFSFGDNDGKTIGPDDDDFVQIAFRFPVNSVFSASITDVFLFGTAIENPIFPEETVTEVTSEAVGGALPIPTPENKFQAVEYRDGGFEFAGGTVIIGALLQTLKKITDPESRGYLYCNGTSHKPCDVPRLAAEYTEDSPEFRGYLSGTGYGWVKTKRIDVVDAASILIANNSAGTVAPLGVATSGFTVRQVAAGRAFQVGSELYRRGRDLIIFAGKMTTPGLIDTAGAPGFVASILTEGAPSGSLIETTYKVVCPPVSTGLEGDFFNFDALVANFYVWYRVNGVGVDPAVGGRTGLRVDLETTEDADTIALKTKDTIAAVETSWLTCTAAAGLAGTYFTVTTQEVDAYLWFTVDGSGTDPLVSGREGTKVELASTDDAPAVSFLVSKALEFEVRFGAVDLRNAFLRGAEDAGQAIGNVLPYARYNPMTDAFGLGGGQQLEEFQSHFHEVPQFTDSAAGFFSIPNADVTDFLEQTTRTFNQGGDETRVGNVGVYNYIKF